jgi:hypothetical protein
MAVKIKNLRNSVFTQISSEILIEYTYGGVNPPSELTAEVGSPSSRNNFIIYKNDYDLFNGTNFITSSVNNDTANSPMFNVLPISATRFSDNTSNTPIQYFQADERISRRFLATELPNQLDVIYDRVRVHFASGWNFGDSDGIIIYAQALERSGNFCTLASLRHLRSDDWFTFNPKPILFGESLYDTYVEFLIPSVREMQVAYDVAPPSVKPNTLAARFTTNGGGFNENRPVYIGAFLIEKTVVKNGFRFFDIGAEFLTSFSQGDEFQDIFAEIKESDNGDYFEYSVRNGNASIEDFIFRQNSRADTNYIIVHRLTVIEQVGASEIVTDVVTRPQDGNFSNPLKFRPVLDYSSESAAFSIEYEATLLNRAGGRSINRRARITCLDCHKYGRMLRRIQINNAIPQKVYNKIIDGVNLSVNSLTEMPVMTKYVYTFFNQADIVTKAERLLINEAGEIVNESSSNTKELKGQGQLTLLITPFDNFYKFNIYKVDDDVANLLNLNLSAKYCLVFFDDNNNRVYINTDKSVESNSSAGELIFKLKKDDAQKILTFSNRNFFLVYKNGETGLESNMYMGKWASEMEAVVTQPSISTSNGATNTVQPVSNIDSTGTNNLTGSININAEISDREALDLAKKQANERQSAITTPIDIVEDSSNLFTTAKKGLVSSININNTVEGVDAETINTFAQFQIPGVAVSKTSNVQGKSIKQSLRKNGNS